MWKQLIKEIDFVDSYKQKSDIFESSKHHFDINTHNTNLKDISSIDIKQIDFIELFRFALSQGCEGIMLYIGYYNSDADNIRGLVDYTLEQQKLDVSDTIVDIYQVVPRIWAANIIIPNSWVKDITSDTIDINGLSLVRPTFFIQCFQIQEQLKKQVDLFLTSDVSYICTLYIFGVKFIEPRIPLESNWYELLSQFDGRRRCHFVTNQQKFVGIDVRDKLLKTSVHGYADDFGVMKFNTHNTISNVDSKKDT